MTSFFRLTAAGACLGATLALTSCASGPTRQPGDPLEPMNRAIFKINDKIDSTVAVPVARGYQRVTPQPARTAISNFFGNLGDIGNFANNVLQLRVTDAAQDLMRLALNTVFGIGGLMDLATPAGLPKHHQDFGLTMARWGMPSGPYLVLPLFGPSDFRDAVGQAVDVRFNALNYIDPSVRNPLYVTQFVSVRSDMLGATDLLAQAALDPYSFVRDAYMQRRRPMTYKAHASETALPNYGDPGESTGNGAEGASGPAGTSGSGNANATSGPAMPAPAAAPAIPKPAAEPNDLPQYQDPGASGT